MLSIFQTIVLYLSCVMFALLMTPSEAAPAPAPSPQLGLESLLLAKLLFLKGKNMRKKFILNTI